MRRAFSKSTPDDEQRRLPPTSQPFTYEIETEQHQRLIKKTLSVSSLFFSGSRKVLSLPVFPFGSAFFIFICLFRCCQFQVLGISELEPNGLCWGVSGVEGCRGRHLSTSKSRSMDPPRCKNTTMQHGVHRFFQKFHPFIQSISLPAVYQTAPRFRRRVV